MRVAALTDLLPLQSLTLVRWNSHYRPKAEVERCEVIALKQTSDRARVLKFLS